MIQKLFLFCKRKYLSFSRSGKRSKGDVGGKSCREAWLGILLSLVIDAEVVKGRGVVTFKLNGWRVGDRDLRRRGLTPVKKNLPVDHVLSDEPLSRYCIHLLHCKDDVLRPANSGYIS